MNHEKQNPLIVIASNRGPFQFQKTAEGWASERGAGGLVTALSALAQQMDVLWVAAALGTGDRAWASAHADQTVLIDDISLRLLIPDEEAYRQYYNVIANPLLWFIQHDLWDMSRHPAIVAETWRAWHEGYVAINQQFAHTIAAAIEAASPDPERPIIVMPQDYHLYLVPQALRTLLGERIQIQPFLHIPWPGIDSWRILPGEMRNTILESLLAADRVGFQSRRDAFNFVQTARFYLEEAHTHGARDAITYRDRRVLARAYPISVDVAQIEALTHEPQTRLFKGMMNNLIGGRKLILRVDRVEPSKNVLRGLQAYRALLEAHPEHRGRVQMLALLVPSRMEVDEYQSYLRDVMAEAGMINAEYSDGFWEPVQIILGNNYPRAVAAMQLYDVLLVNPLADGMNLVAKEGPLVNEQDGVLVLSEHAGAFYELGEYALAVSPFDVYGTASAMHTALTMPEQERRERAENLARIVRARDVAQWFADQLDDALSAFSNQSSRSSTSAMSSAKISADSATTSGMASD